MVEQNKTNGWSDYSKRHGHGKNDQIMCSKTYQQNSTVGTK